MLPSHLALALVGDTVVKSLIGELASNFPQPLGVVSTQPSALCFYIVSLKDAHESSHDPKERDSSR